VVKGREVEGSKHNSEQSIKPYNIIDSQVGSQVDSQVDSQPAVCLMPISPIVPFDPLKIVPFDPLKVAKIDFYKIVGGIFIRLDRFEKRLENLERVTFNENAHLRESVIENRSSNTNTSFWTGFIVGGIVATIVCLIVSSMSSSSVPSMSLGRIAGSAIQAGVNYGIRRAISKVL
jgi:hypothetical protein